jgi:hypothetical protein
MRNAVSMRLEKPLSPPKPKADKAKILKFDRRTGVVLLEKAEPTAKTSAVIRLVRNLLRFLTRKGPAAKSMKRTRAAKTRK